MDSQAVKQAISTGGERRESHGNQAISTWNQLTRKKNSRLGKELSNRFGFLFVRSAVDILHERILGLQLLVVGGFGRSHLAVCSRQAPRILQGLTGREDLSDSLVRV